jgi:hypothetical protein
MESGRITAFNTPEVQNTEADAVLFKPFDLPEFMAMVETLLGPGLDRSSERRDARTKPSEFDLSGRPDCDRRRSNDALTNLRGVIKTLDSQLVSCL